jgi:hypothetical protein
MNQVEAKEIASQSGSPWLAANYGYLQAELGRLRLLLHRRVLWLRQGWKRDVTPETPSFQGAVITDSDVDLLLSRGVVDAEAGFYEENEAARGVTRELEEQQARIHAAADAVLAAGGPPALEILARLFGLGPFERDVLLLCLAPEMDAHFERLYAYVQDDAARRYPSPGLALQLFGSSLVGQPTGAPERTWIGLAPDAPLRRFRLLQTEPASAISWGNEPLRLERRVGYYLLGINHLDEQAASFLRAVEDPGRLSPDQIELVDQLERRLHAWIDREHIPAINLTGEPGSGRLAIAYELCARLGVSLQVLDPSRLPGGADRLAAYRLLEREGLLLPCAYYLDFTQLDHRSPTDAVPMVELVQQIRALLLIASREPVSTERVLQNVRVARSTSATQLSVWKADLGVVSDGFASGSAPDAADLFLSRLVQQFYFGPQQIHRVTAVAREQASMRHPDNPVLTPNDVWQACCGHAARSMEGLAEKIEAKRSLEDLILPPELMQQIREIAVQVEHRARVYDQWGFGAKLSRGRGIAALFAGPSGTGKTMAAEVLAQNLQLDLYRIDLASVISKYIGETEKNLRKVFDAAEESGAILFFDEADALFGKRSEVRDSHDRYANIEINYLLQRMEDYRGLAILATNRKSSLDTAFLRRLRFLLDFPFPSLADRVRIWRGAFPAQAAVDSLDYEFLGRLEITGGNIFNIALNAAFLASAEAVSINMHHVLTAARREYAKMDKLVLESEFGRYYSAVHR